MRENDYQLTTGNMGSRSRPRSLLILRLAIALLTMDEGSTSLDAPGETGSQDWVVTIKDSIKQYAERKNVVGLKRRTVIRRVPQDIRELNPKLYCATEFSIGLLDRCPLDPRKRRADLCKVAMATAVLQIMGMTETDWEEFCSMVVPNPEEIQDHYDEQERNPFSQREVQSVLALDAVFVAGHLGGMHKRFARLFPSISMAFESIIHGPTDYQIIADLLKVENQIPLSLLRNVLLILVEKVGGDSDQLVEDVLSRICFVAVPSHLLPGYDPDHTHAATEFLKCKNLLDCVYRTINHDLKGGDFTGGVPVNLPSATQLQKAGIEIRGRKGFHDIKFEPGIIKGILYLPTLHIQDDTEQVWKNLVAYDQLTSCGRGDFTQYLSLMDNLIDSANDVMILKSGRFPTVITNGLGTNEAVAQLFNTMLQNCEYNTNYKWIELHQEIYHFYKNGQRQMYLEFMETYFGKPWLTVSVVAAIVLLIMTLLQTYYTIAGYYHTFN